MWSFIPAIGAVRDPIAQFAHVDAQLCSSTLVLIGGAPWYRAVWACGKTNTNRVNWQSLVVVINIRIICTISTCSLTFSVTVHSTNTAPAENMADCTLVLMAPCTEGAVFIWGESHSFNCCSQNFDACHSLIKLPRSGSQMAPQFTLVNAADYRRYTDMFPKGFIWRNL